MPPTWDTTTKAAFLYEFAAEVPQHHRAKPTQLKSLKQVGYLLKHCKLLPLRVPPMKLPEGLRAAVPKARRVLRWVLDRLQPEAARNHLLRKARCCLQGPGLALQKISSKHLGWKV